MGSLSMTSRLESMGVATMAGVDGADATGHTGRMFISTSSPMAINVTSRQIVAPSLPPSPLRH